MNRGQVLGCIFAVLVASVLLYVVARDFVKRRKKSARRKADDTGATSSSAASAVSDSYDVFLSFRGKDTRKIFTDHLYNSLVNAGIRVFRDDNELREGEKIGVNQFQAIKNSKISIPILSVNYASSKWCLRELVEMTECMKSVGHVVLPIFYRVEPAHVRHQIGSFGEKFFHLSEKYTADAAKWKQALQEVASLKGWESEKTANGHEGYLVKMVVKKVLSELKKAFQLFVTEQLIGIDNAVQDILRLLDGNLEATQNFGIYGMGGIGKTTLAKVIHNTLSDQFQHRSFIADIRESSQRHGIPYLQEQLIHNLREEDRVHNKYEGIGILKSRFKHKKVLILLDDVDDDVQIKDLVGNFDWFGMGSKIIITTRSKHVLDKVGVNNTYELKGLAKDESLILFSRHAFFMDSPPCEFDSLSRAVVSTIGGLPLALEVIGSFLHGRDQNIWQDALEKLQKVPHEKVREKLMISYNALNYAEKQIFLDIACFFIGEDLRYASYMWDACDYYPRMGIETLSFMSLIKIGDHGKVQMHDQLRDLGREIVQQEDHEVPMNRSRLWVEEEALEVLERNKGIQKDRVRALCLDKDWKNKENRIFFGGHSKREFTTEQFETLPNLRFLTVRAKLIGDSRNLLRELRWLMWWGCPAFKATDFCLEKLVILDLSHSDISQLWEGWNHLKMAKQLKVLNLSNCDCLEVTPDLSAFPNLEIFKLKACCNLKRIHPSIGAAKGLVFLDLQECYKIQKLPQEMGELEKLKELYISKTAIGEIPPCIGSLKKLEVLSAANCKSLVGLPDSISHLVNLLTLDLNCCSSLCKLPESIGSLVKLERLSCNDCIEISDSSIHELPESIGDLKNLKFLDIHNRKKLSNLPSTISKLGNLEELDATYCKNLKGEIHIDGLASLKILKLGLTDVFGFHGTLDKLSRLEKLEIDRCWKLQSLSELPASLTVLKVTCQHRTFPRLSHLIHLKELIVTCCPLLKSMPELPSGLLTLHVLSCDELKEFPSLSSLEFLLDLFLGWCGELTKIEGLEGLKSLATLQVNQCGKLPNLDGLEHLRSLRSLWLLSNGPILNDDQVQGLEKLKNLEELKVWACESLVRLDVSQLTHLRLLHLWKCPNLVEIKGVERLKNLRDFKLEGCPSVGTLPDLSCFHNLESVVVDERSNLADVPGVKKAKYLGGGAYEYRPNFLDPSNFEDSISHRMANVEEKRQVASIGKYVGTDDQVNHIMSLMNIDARDKRMVVVIHGEAGIGKTTLAKHIYNQVSWDFDGCSFLADITETTQELGGLQLLQTKLISDVLKQELQDVAFINREIEFLRDLFCNMRVLIVLDDVENAFHVEKLIGDGLDCFASGSRILVTTRNSGVLEESPQIWAYHVSRLNKDQAFQLLRQHASIPTSYASLPTSLEILNNAVNAVAGLPLFIEVMVAVLNGTPKERWSQLSTEPVFRQQNFLSFLQKVYRTLDYKQKQIFLDIACFTTGIYSRIAWYLWYDTSFLPSSEILTPLARIGENNQIWMHSLLRQFGREIVSMENLRDPGKQSRLFNHEIALDTIKRKKGTEKVEALCLNFHGHTSDKLTPEDFESMPNLRFLQLDHADIAGDFANLFPNLRWLRWRGCPRHLQVTNFQLGNITILDLSWSKVTKEWEGWDQIEMKNLRVLDLTGCADLLVTPKFSSYKNLTLLILEQCSQLVKIDHSIGDLQHLVTLNLKFCTELSMLPVEVGHLTDLKELLMDGTSVQEIPICVGHLKQLETLTTSNCFSLSQLPRTIRHLTSISLLSLDGTNITALPDSVGELFRLKHLSLRDCRRIRKLPNSIGNIGRSLVELDVSGTGIFKFPNSLKNLQNLKVLRMDSCFFREFPPDIGELTSLEEIHASWCQSIEGGIPSNVSKLHNLRVLRLRHSSISSIPAEIHRLSSLRILDLLHCDMMKELPRLPSSITVLLVDDELKSSHYHSQESFLQDY